MKKVIVDEQLCTGCLNCRLILNPCDDSCMPRMPQMAFQGWQVNRLEKDAEERITAAIEECPTNAITVSGPLDGKWKVTCFGWAAPFNILGDHKVIAGDQGHNEVVGILAGYFYVEPLLKGLGEGFRLIYNHNMNDVFFHDIIDVITPMGENTYRGILYKGGEKKFTFTLEKVV